MTANAGRVFDGLSHMLDELRRIERYTAGMDEAAFLADVRTQGAVIRNIEVIGEAARNVQQHDPVLAASHPDVPWAIAYRMRNALSHGYANVDLGVGWRTVRVSWPGLRMQVASILDGWT